MKHLNLILKPHILSTSANEVIGKETGDHYSVFYNDFARSAQSAQMLHNALRHTDDGRDNLLFTSLIDPLFSFLISMVGSKMIFFLKIISIFCV